MHRPFRNRGFTVVELLVVIMVISILASIVAVSYSRSSAQARDAKRVADLEMITDAITSYRLKYGDHVEGGSCPTGGNGGTGNGYFNYVNGTTYLKSVLSCLTDKGYLNANTTDPSGCGTQAGNAPGKVCKQAGYMYMKSSCIPAGQTETVTVVMARLELSGNVADLQGANAICSSATYSASPYFMNYMVKVE